MADDGDPVHVLEERLHFVGVVLGIALEDVFVDGASRRAVDCKDGRFTAGRRLDDPDAQVAEEVVALGLGVFVGLGVELIAGPERGGLGNGIEVGGLVQDAEVVVSHERPLAASADDVDAFERVRAVAHDIAQADDAVDPARVDVSEDLLECLGVSMDVADDGCGHDASGSKNGPRSGRAGDGSGLRRGWQRGGKG